MHAHASKDLPLKMMVSSMTWFRSVTSLNQSDVVSSLGVLSNANHAPYGLGTYVGSWYVTELGMYEKSTC